MVGEKLAEAGDERWLVKHSPIWRRFLLPHPLWAAAQVCGPPKRALLSHARFALDDCVTGYLGEKWHYPLKRTWLDCSREVLEEQPCSLSILQGGVGGCPHASETGGLHGGEVAGVNQKSHAGSANR